MFWHFFQPPLAPRLSIKLIWIFFQWTGHEKLGYEHTFQPYTYTLRSFSRVGGLGAPLRLYRDSDPPAFTGLILMIIYSFFPSNLFLVSSPTLTEQTFSLWPWAEVRNQIHKCSSKICNSTQICLELPIRFSQCFFYLKEPFTYLDNFRVN